MIITSMMLIGTFTRHVLFPKVGPLELTLSVSWSFILILVVVTRRATIQKNLQSTWYKMKSNLNRSNQRLMKAREKR